MDLSEFGVPDGILCCVCDHFIADREDEDVYLFEGRYYCEPHYKELDIYPSAQYWAPTPSWKVEEFRGEEE